MQIQILRSAVYSGSWRWQLVREADGVILGSSEQRWGDEAAVERAVEELMTFLKADVTVVRVAADGSHLVIAEYAAEGAK